MLTHLALTVVVLCFAGCTGAAAEAVSKQTGMASWYGKECRKTASGERYDPSSLTAAHRTLPFGTTVRVTTVKTQRSVVLRINNRGPFRKGRVIDVSRAAAQQLGMIGSGVARVEVEVLDQPIRKVRAIAAD
jgi:rare lipoprotein A